MGGEVSRESSDSSDDDDMSFGSVDGETSGGGGDATGTGGGGNGMNCAHAPRPPNPQSSPQSNRVASPIVPPSSPATASLFIDRVSGPPSMASAMIATSARLASRRPGAHVPHRRRPMRRLDVSLTSLDIAADVSRYPRPRSARRGLCRPSRKRRHQRLSETHTFAADQTDGPNVWKVRERKAENGRTPLIGSDEPNVQQAHSTRAQGTRAWQLAGDARERWEGRIGCLASSR